MESRKSKKSMGRTATHHQSLQVGTVLEDKELLAKLDAAYEIAKQTLDGQFTREQANAENN